MKLMLKAHWAPLRATKSPAAAMKSDGETKVTTSPPIVAISPIMIAFFLPIKSPKIVKIRNANMVLVYMKSMAKLSIEASSAHL